MDVFPPQIDRLASARQALLDHYGHSGFRPLQGVIVGAVIAGKDVLAVLPTGGGKSICYQIPAVLRSGLTLVISPLIALMQDQVDSARRRGIPSGMVNSSQSEGDQQEVLSRVRRGEIRLLYAAPERLVRLASELLAMRIRPTLMAVDEAHCISEWGHDFRPAYRALGRARWQLGWPQTIGLTGSATVDVRSDIHTVLRLGRVGRGRRHPFATYVGSFDRPNLVFGVRAVKSDQERLRHLLLKLRRTSGSAIVYAPTRNLSESLSRILWHHGVRAIPYHAGLTADRRRRTLVSFLDRDIQVVVATCAFGMGIDAPHVRLVAHWAPPPTIEAYYQEAGRAGRDGDRAECLLMHHRADFHLRRRLLLATFPPRRLVERAWNDPEVSARLPDTIRFSVERLRGELRPDRGPVDWSLVRKRRRLALERLRAVESYAKTRRCRRRVLMEWFGEPVRVCSGCDRCEAG